jgi:predicted nucleotidyltransferase
MKSKASIHGQLIPILEEFKQSLVSIFGVKFSSLVLFGSFARNEFTFESDVDLLLVLKDSSSNSGDEKNTKLIPLISRFLIKSGYLFSVVVKDESELSEQKYGLVQNIEQEGITL